MFWLVDYVSDLWVGKSYVFINVFLCLWWSRQEEKWFLQSTELERVLSDSDVNNDPCSQVAANHPGACQSWKQSNLSWSIIVTAMA